MLSFLNPYMLYIKLGAVVILCLGSAAAANYVRGNADQVKYSALELSKAKADTKSVQDSLAQLQGFITTMDAVGVDYTAALATIKAQFATIQKELRNATLKPLPADCRPDAGRLRVLTDAVNATRQGSEPAK